MANTDDTFSVSVSQTNWRNFVSNNEDSRAI
jgi:hypothetical protein